MKRYPYIFLHYNAESALLSLRAKKKTIIWTSDNVEMIFSIRVAAYLFCRYFSVDQDNDSFLFTIIIGTEQEDRK